MRATLKSSHHNFFSDVKRKEKDGNGSSNTVRSGGGRRKWKGADLCTRSTICDLGRKPRPPLNLIVRLKRLIHSPLNGSGGLNISRSPEGSIALPALAVIKNERDLIVNLSIGT